MSLFGTVRIAQNTLVASSIGMQVAGNNIANASTPGYLRQEASFVPAPTQLIGGIPVGLGVRVEGIRQQFDKYLEDRLRSATSDLASSEQQEDVYLKLEAILGELGDTDLSTSLNAFFGSVNDILNQPESESVRNLAILKGQTLADDIDRLATRIRQLRSGLNDRVAGSISEINGLTKEIAKLNLQIVELESGTTTSSDAVGLRDHRVESLAKLASLLDIRAIEQDNGAVAVFAGGNVLVTDGTSLPVSLEHTSDRGLLKADVVIEETDSILPIRGGEIGGLITARDTILGDMLDKFDDFTRTLIFEFNKVFSSGQGLTGYQRLTSEFGAADATAPLDNAGLPYTPRNGSIQIITHNGPSGIQKSTDIFVHLSGLSTDTTLQELVDQVDAIDGVSATLTAGQQVQITSDSPEIQFAFANDTSGILAALGINTFFTGTGATSIGVNEAVRSDASKFTASRGGIGKDSENVALLAALQDAPISESGNSIASAYQSFAAEITQGSAVSRSVADGFRVFHNTLDGEKLGISGVSIDDEALKIILYQRMFQASARVITTINDLLETLINL